MTSYRNGVKEAEILIYRNEELVKVLVHEIIHAFKLDSALSGFNSEENINRLFKLSNNVNTNECFTETYACLINLCLGSCMLASKKRKIVLSVLFMELLRVEISHIARVAIRVLEQDNILLTGSKVDVQRDIKVESTHIISYYFLKCINILNLERFVEYISKHDYMIGDLREYVGFMELLLSQNNLIISLRRIKKESVKEIKIKSEMENKKIIRKGIEIAYDTQNLRMSCIDTMLI
jgi:hypothetical protein